MKFSFKIIKQFHKSAYFVSMILIFFIAFLTSCNQNQSERTTIATNISFPSIKEVAFDNMFSETNKKTQLESRKDIMLGDDLHFYFHIEDIYILDKSQKKLLRFNNNGSYLNPIGKIGKGPGELLSFDDYFVDDHGVTVLSRGGEITTKIINYTFKGEQTHIGILQDFIGFSIEGYQGQYLLYTGFNKFKHAYRLYRLDSALNKIDTYLKNDYSGELIPLIENNFSRYENRLFIKEGMKPVIYEIFENEMKPVYSFDFGDYSVPEEFWDMNGIKGFQMIMKQGFASIRYFFQNNKYAFFVIVVQKEGNKTKIYYVINNREKNEWEMSEREDDESLNYKTPIGINSENEIMFIGYPDMDLMKEHEKLRGMTIKNPMIKYYKILQ